MWTNTVLPVSSALGIGTLNDYFRVSIKQQGCCVCVGGQGLESHFLKAPEAVTRRSQSSNSRFSGPKSPTSSRRGVSWSRLQMSIPFYSSGSAGSDVTLPVSLRHREAPEMTTLWRAPGAISTEAWGPAVVAALG